MRPTILAGCELLDRIATGAASVIYRARDRKSGAIVAVKHLVVREKADRKYLRHARNEYRVLKALEGPDGRPPDGIVRALRRAQRGFLRRRKEHILVMEYLDGPDLRRERRYPLGQMVDILTQVASAVSAIHTRGYVHGDLKPENIIVNHDGVATLVDFGFACKIGARLSTVRGTREYIAPEQVERGIMTVQTDLYNLGATMYFLLTGRHVPAIIAPHENGAHFIAHHRARAQPPKEIRPEIPAALDDVVMRCLERDPLARPSCMEEVLSILLGLRKMFTE